MIFCTIMVTLCVILYYSLFFTQVNVLVAMISVFSMGVFLHRFTQRTTPVFNLEIPQRIG